MCVCVCQRGCYGFYTVPNTARTVLAEKRVWVALGHLILSSFFCECVCVCQSRISHFPRWVEESAVSVCEKMLIDVCLHCRYASGSRLLNRKTPQMACAVCACVCACVCFSAQAVWGSRRHLSPQAHPLSRKENGIIDIHHCELAISVVLERRQPRRPENLAVGP